MKKILAIIFCILFIAFGLALRETHKENQKLELKNAIKDYEKASTKSEEVKADLANQKNLNSDEIAKLKDLEQKHKALLKQFDEYKLKYPKNTTEEIKKMESENKKYSKKISELESNISQLKDKVVVQQQVVSSSSSNTGSSKKESNKSSSSSSSNTDSSKKESNKGSSSSSSNTGSSNNISSSGGSSNSSSQDSSSNEISQNESSETVYANGGSSKSNKYHSSPTAHNMEGAIAMSKSEAISRGYVACKRCY
ncbi:hypothetical protein ACQQ2T_04995 [Paraclostridium tenue]